MGRSFISVDVESSGPIHGVNSLLEIGAVDCDNFANSFQVYIIPTSEEWTESARLVNKSHEFYVNNGNTAYNAMKKFDEWLDKFHKPIFVGFNAPFDYGWINYYFHIFLGRNPFGINALDIKAYAMGKLNLDNWSETTKKHLKAKGIMATIPHTHEALTDAKEQAEIFNLLRRI